MLGVGYLVPNESPRDVRNVILGDQNPLIGILQALGDRTRESTLDSSSPRFLQRHRKSIWLKAPIEEHYVSSNL